MKLVLPSSFDSSVQSVRRRADQLKHTVQKVHALHFQGDPMGAHETTPQCMPTEQLLMYPVTLQRLNNKNINVAAK